MSFLEKLRQRIRRKTESSDLGGNTIPWEILSDLEEGESAVNYRGVIFLSSNHTDFVYECGADLYLARTLRANGTMTADEIYTFIDEWHDAEEQPA